MVQQVTSVNLLGGNRENSQGANLLKISLREGMGPSEWSNKDGTGEYGWILVSVGKTGVLQLGSRCLTSSRLWPCRSWMAPLNAAIAITNVGRFSADRPFKSATPAKDCTSSDNQTKKFEHSCNRLSELDLPLIGSTADLYHKPPGVPAFELRFCFGQ